MSDTLVLNRPLSGLQPNVDHKTRDSIGVLEGSNFRVLNSGLVTAYGAKANKLIPQLRLPEYASVVQNLLFSDEFVIDLDTQTIVYVWETKDNIKGRWTSAYVGGVYYFCRAGRGLYTYNYTTKQFLPATVAGSSIAVTDYIACASVAGRLVALTEDAIAYSDFDDGSNIGLTNIDTGAAVQSLVIAGNGKGLALVSTYDSMYVFTQTGVIIGSGSDAVSAFRFQAVIGRRYAPLNSFCVAPLEEHSHVILTEAGLFVVTTGEALPQPWEPEMSEYLVRQYFVYGRTEVALTYVAELQEIMVSVQDSRTRRALYDKAFTYYLPTRMWGSFNEHHYLVSDYGYVDINGEFYNWVTDLYRTKLNHSAKYVIPPIYDIATYTDEDGNLVSSGMFVFSNFATNNTSSSFFASVEGNLREFSLPEIILTSLPDYFQGSIYSEEPMLEPLDNVTIDNRNSTDTLPTEPQNNVTHQYRDTVITATPEPHDNAMVSLYSDSSEDEVVLEPADSVVTETYDSGTVLPTEPEDNYNSELHFTGTVATPVPEDNTTELEPDEIIDYNLLDGEEDWNELNGLVEYNDKYIVNTYCTFGNEVSINNIVANTHASFGNEFSRANLLVDTFCEFGLWFQLGSQVANTYFTMGLEAYYEQNVVETYCSFGVGISYGQILCNTYSDFGLQTRYGTLINQTSMQFAGSYYTDVIVPQDYVRESLGSYLVMGAYRFTDQATVDALSVITNLAIGSEERNVNIDELDYEEEPDEIIDYNLLDGEEDWGVDASIVPLFDVSVEGTLDGYKIWADQLHEPQITVDNGNMKYYSLYSTGIYHRVKIDASEYGQAVNLKFLELQGFLGGRL